MFHRAKNLKILEGTNLEVTFQDGSVVQYDVLQLFDKYPQLQALESHELFQSAQMSPYGIRWNDELDLETETIYEDGKVVRLEEPTIAERVGIRIKAARTEAGLSQIELSKLTGIDQADLSKIESGLMNPSISTLDRIAKALHKNLKLNLSEIKYASS